MSHEVQDGFCVYCSCHDYDTHCRDCTPEREALASKPYDNALALARIAELEAEVQRLREQTQWRLIETAPKRQPVLVLCEGGQSYVLYQTDNGDGYIDTWRWQDGTAFGRWPTHWMPLQQPPQAQENERE